MAVAVAVEATATAMAAGATRAVVGVVYAGVADATNHPAARLLPHRHSQGSRRGLRRSCLWCQTG